MFLWSAVIRKACRGVTADDLPKRCVVPSLPQCIPFHSPRAWGAWMCQNSLLLKPNLASMSRPDDSLKRACQLSQSQLFWV